MMIYQELTSGMQITNADITKKLQEWIDGYVDDTSIFTNIDETQEAPLATTIAKQLQNEGSIWERLLLATGGKLELTKCFYYILQWKLDDEGVPSHTSKQELEDIGVEIEILEIGKDQPTEIKHLDCEVAHRTLGVYKTITGNQQKQKRQATPCSESGAGEVYDRLRQQSCFASYFRPFLRRFWNDVEMPGKL
jgi:hypothetical protein